MVFYATFNNISVISQRYHGSTSTRLGSEVSCPRTLPRQNQEDPVRLEPRIPGLQVKHFTTEPCGTEQVLEREREISTNLMETRCVCETQMPPQGPFFFFFPKTEFDIWPWPWQMTLNLLPTKRYTYVRYVGPNCYQSKDMAQFLWTNGRAKNYMPKIYRCSGMKK